MNIKKEKGSIAIFVLVALLFMVGFLILAFASNANQSKAIKEQSEVIHQIYAYSGEEQGAYNKAYTDLRRKNKQLMTVSVENNNTLELNKTYAEKVNNYRIYGNSVQNGTPTPSNPVEIQSVGEKINLFNPAYTLKKNRGFNETLENGKVSIKRGDGASGYVMFENIFTSTSNKIQLYVEAKPDNGDMNKFSPALLLSVYDANKNDITSSVYASNYYNSYYNAAVLPGGINSPYTRNLPDSVKYFRIGVRAGSGELAQKIIFTNFVVETTDTYIDTFNGIEYQIPIKLTGENGESIRTNILLDEPLRSLKRLASEKVYSDYIDFKTKKVVRVVKEKVFNGDEEGWKDYWTSSVTSKSMGIYYRDYEELGQHLTPTLYDNTGLCSHFRPTTAEVNTANDSLIGYFNTRASSDPPYIGFKIPFTTRDAWRQYLREQYNANNPLRVHYALITPIEQTIDLPELSTFEDYTKIEILTKTKPLKIEVEYTGYTLD